MARMLEASQAEATKLLGCRKEINDQSRSKSTSCKDKRRPAPDIYPRELDERMAIPCTELRIRGGSRSLQCLQQIPWLPVIFIRAVRWCQARARYVKGELSQQPGDGGDASLRIEGIPHSVARPVCLLYGLSVPMTASTRRGSNPVPIYGLWAGPRGAAESPWSWRE